MIRAVLDTNIWVSAILSDGPPRIVIKLLVARQFRAATSVDLIDEFERVLRNKLHYNDEQVTEHRREMERLTELILPSESLSVINHKPDNRVLECALEANADLIVSGDKKHLLVLGEFHGIPIVPPAEFLEQFTRPVPK